jgi:hypothetical protein
MKGGRLFLTGVLGLALVGAAGCNSASQSAATAPASAPTAVATVAPSQAPSELEDLPIPSAVGDPAEQWCTAYANITSVLADAGTSPEKAATALTVLDRFGELWASASQLEFINPDEAAANQRAVGRYGVIIQLMAAGAAEDSAEVKAASDELTASTEADHALLQSSAGKVLGMCGSPAPPASPSPASS